MKIDGATTVLRGMAEVSVKEIIALEKSVTDKDQTIGSLREQIKSLGEKIEDVKADAIAKQAMVIIQESTTTKKGDVQCAACGWYFNHTSRITCPNCGINLPVDSSIIYKNLDNVIEDIRKKEAKKLGIDLEVSENKINELSLEKTKLQNKLEFELKQVREDLAQEIKERNETISKSNETIRKHMGGIVEEQMKELDALKEELVKVKKNKTDEQTEEARKQEIIDLKERITELETITENPLGLSWFKKSIYNWLKVDVAVELQTKHDTYAKQKRVNEISNNYPNSKSFWTTSNIGFFNSIW